MRILRVVGFAAFFFDRNRIFGHVRSDAVRGCHLPRIERSGVGNRDLLSILHLRESIIESLPCCRICCIVGRIACYLHIIIKDQRGSGNHILNIDVFGISLCVDFDRIMIGSGLLVKCPALRRKCVRMIIIIDNDLLLYLITEMDRFLCSVERCLELRPEGYIVRVGKTGEVRIALVKFDCNLPVCRNIQCRGSLVGSAAAVHYN